MLLTDYVAFFLKALSIVWFLILPILAWNLFYERWMRARAIDYGRTTKNVLLEIIPPRDLEKTPLGMEHVFTSLHASVYGGTWEERYLQGYRPSAYMFELVANNGHLQFFVRCSESLKHFVETRIFSQYPEAEIRDAEDYFSTFPSALPNKDWDLYGTEFKLSKSDVYKIKTYPEIESTSQAIQEPKRHDSISLLSEAASYLSKDEWIVFQLYAQPTPSDKDVSPDVYSNWMATATKEKNKLIGEEEKAAPKSLVADLIEVPIEAVKGVAGILSGGIIKAAEEKKEEKKAEPRAKLRTLTETERHTLEDLEDKMSKMIYKSGIRALYIARKDVFEKNNESRTPLIYGTLKIFDDPSGNQFVDNDDVATYASGPSEERKKYIKKLTIFGNAKTRSGPDATYALCTEELASIFHLPTVYVGPAGVRRVESKKGPAEINLPVIE